MEKELMIATTNLGKIRELKAMLAPLAIKVHSQTDFKMPIAEETGLSFFENALIKARHASQHSNLPALADDSGLCVDALTGRPGIYSARFAGENATDRENNCQLLKELNNVVEKERQAHFFCALVYVRHPWDQEPLFFQGIWRGNILFEPKGEAGFGYDPLFYLSGLGCSSAELDQKTKNQISHRGQALLQFIDYCTNDNAGE